METHTYAALNSGDVTNDEIDEFLLFFGTQLGWPKGSAMSTYILTRDGEDRRGARRGAAAPDFVPWADPVDDDVRRARGEAAYVAVHGCTAPAAHRRRSGAAAYLDFLYGEVWTRDEHLTRRDRRMVSICCGAALGVDDRDQPSTSRRRCAAASSPTRSCRRSSSTYAVYLGWIVARRLDDLLVAVADAPGSRPG